MVLRCFERLVIILWRTVFWRTKIDRDNQCNALVPEIPHSGRHVPCGNKKEQIECSLDQTPGTRSKCPGIRIHQTTTTRNHGMTCNPNVGYQSTMFKREPVLSHTVTVNHSHNHPLSAVSSPHCPSKHAVKDRSKSLQGLAELNILLQLPLSQTSSNT